MKIEELYPGIVVFDLYTQREALNLLVDLQQQRDDEPPNSMNKYGAVPRGAFWRKELARLVRRYVQPISTLFFPEMKRLRVNPYAFSVDYEDGKQKALAKHFDSSDVTLNVCLGGRYAEGDLVFYGGRRAVFTYSHVLGRAIVHRGSFVHRALPIKPIQPLALDCWRTNLILWCSTKK